MSFKFEFLCFRTACHLFKPESLQLRHTDFTKSYELSEKEKMNMLGKFNKLSDSYRFLYRILNAFLINTFYHSDSFLTKIHIIKLFNSLYIELLFLRSWFTSAIEAFVTIILVIILLYLEGKIFSNRFYLCASF